MVLEVCGVGPLGRLVNSSEVGCAGPASLRGLLATVGQAI